MLLTTSYWLFTCITHKGSVPSCSPRERLDEGSTIQTTFAKDLGHWSPSPQLSTSTVENDEYVHIETGSNDEATSKSATGKDFEKGITGKDLTIITTEMEPPPEPEPDFADEDLQQISSTLRGADSAILGEYGLSINFQNKSAQGYNAPKKFIRSVASGLLKRPTFETFLNMTGDFNRVSPEEKQRKIDAFLNDIFQSDMWNTLYDFLNKNSVRHAKNFTTFQHYVKQIWFDSYPYNTGKGVVNTSGFEQIFLGEIRRRDETGGVVNGVQNWVRFYQLESKDKDFDYKGYIDRRQNILAKLEFTWHGAVGETSMFIGTSPAYDMAVYTLCFIARLETKCKITMDNCSPEITVYGTMNGKTCVSHLALKLGETSPSCKRE